MSVPDRSAPRPRAGRRVRAYIGLGANLGDAATTLAWAVDQLDARPTITVYRVSPLYATAPWGVTDQPEFRNAVAVVDVRGPSDPDHAAIALLSDLKSIERAAGRREGRRWGPRELDLDLLLFGRHRILVERPPEARTLAADRNSRAAAELLEVPHRDLGERLFVLAPLSDIAPRLVPPGWSETVQTRRRRVAADAAPGSVRRLVTWDPDRRDWL